MFTELMGDIRVEAAFLVQRLRDYEANHDASDTAFREWDGHVAPSLARLESLLKLLEGE